MTARILLIAALLSTMCPSVCLAKIIRLRNGNSVEGTIVDTNEREVLIKVPGLGTLTFSPAEIASIEEDESLPPPTAPPKPPARRTAGDPPPAADAQPAAPSTPEKPEPPPCIVEARLIQSIDWRLRLKYGALSGEVLFVDKDGRYCATTGSFTLRKVVKTTETKTVYDTPTTSHEEEVEGESEETIRSVSFAPKDFDEFTASGGRGFSLPVSVRTSDVKKGDTVILEWRSFRDSHQVN